MKPNELRIGNWVSFDDRLFQIYSISEEFPTLDTEEFGIGVVGYNNLQPIPLTEEVLLKCGFSCTEESETSKGFSIGENIVTYDYLVYLTWLKRIDRKGLDPYPFYRNGRHIVKHLHHLQNLYFALTGQELEIKL